MVVICGKMVLGKIIVIYVFYFIISNNVSLKLLLSYCFMIVD